MHAITVRQAVLADLADAAQLFDQYCQFQGQASDVAAARLFLQARFDHGESIIFLAYAAAQPVGFAQLYPSFSSVALKRVFILNDLFVTEAGRRQQVATQLLATLEAYAWSLDAVRVTLNVAHTNHGGQSLYEARGWTQDAHFLMYHRYPPHPEER